MFTSRQWLSVTVTNPLNFNSESYPHSTEGYSWYALKYEHIRFDINIVESMEEIKRSIVDEITDDDDYGSRDSEVEGRVKEMHIPDTYQKENITSTVDFKLSDQIEPVVNIVESPWVLHTSQTPQEVKVEETPGPGPGPGTHTDEPHVVDFTSQFNRIFVRNVFNSFQG